MGAEQYEQRTRDHYKETDVAARYHAALSVRSSPADWLVAQREIAAVRRCLAAAKIPQYVSVLDVPAGTGKLTELLRRWGISYLALDISAAMLAFLPRNVDCAVADATGLPLRDGAVELAVCFRLLHRVPADVLEAILDQVTRVSSRDLIVSYASTSMVAPISDQLRQIARRPDNREVPMPPRRMAQLLRERGFSVIEDTGVAAPLGSERVVIARRSY